MATTQQHEARPLRYLALGDSYTIGEGVAETARWPVQLARALRTAGLAIDEPLIIARTGWTTTDLLAALEGTPPSGPFDLVSLLIGVNNQYQGRSAQEYQAEFGTLLQSAIKFAGHDPGHVIVVSIPDWGATPFAHGRNRAAIAAEIDGFNTINRTVSAQAGVHSVDVTPISRQALDDSTLLAEDALHPSAEMYMLWVAHILPIAKAIFAQCHSA